MVCVLVKWGDIKEQWDSPAYSKCFRYIFWYIFFSGEPNKPFCHGLAFLWQQLCSFLAAALCKKAATRRNQKQLTGLWKHMGVAGVMSSLEWEVKWPSRCGVVAKSNIIYLLQGPRDSTELGMLSGSFIFTEPLGRRPWLITGNRNTTITQLCGDLKMRLFKWQQWAAFNPTWSSPPKPSAHCSQQHGLCCMGGSHLSHPSIHKMTVAVHELL